MKKILSIILFLPLDLFSQSDSDIKIIVNDYCERAENINWTSGNEHKISTEIAKIALEIRYDYADTIKNLKLAINSKGDYSEKDLEKIFTIQLIEALVENCESYVKLTRNLLEPCPNENRTLELVKNGVDSILIVNNDKSYSESLNIADSQLFNLILDNQDQVNKDYKDGFADPNLSDDLGKYLLHKSLNYYKAFLVTQSVKIFD